MAGLSYIRGEQTLIYLLIFACVFLVVQVVIGGGRQAATKIRLANYRLRRMENDDPQTQVVKQILKSRGMDDKDQISAIISRVDKLILHSGLRLGRRSVYAGIILVSLALTLTVFLIKQTFLWAVLAFICAPLFCLLALKFLVIRRRNKAVEQLPEALDVIVRSLGAGHPVPVAMALVAREMPDPIGTEFGIASDEISFGAGLSLSVQRLSDRVGHADFELFSAMIRLQERTGGNLGELLRASAKTIRDRQRMRLKVKAASAEGRMSALILNAAPLGLFLFLQTVAPSFYGDISDNPMVKYTLWGVVVWMIIGNLVMRRMINFKI